MFTDDLSDSYGPSRADLDALEHIEHHRSGFERARPAGEHQNNGRNRLLSLLDDMEEMVCEEGSSAPALAEAWQQVDELEALYWEGAETSAEAERPRKRGGRDSQPRSASRPGPVRLSARPQPQAANEASSAARPDCQRKAA